MILEHRKTQIFFDVQTNYVLYIPSALQKQTTANYFANPSPHVNMVLRKQKAVAKMCASVTCQSDDNWNFAALKS
jgi:hypothetical protein